MEQQEPRKVYINNLHAFVSKVRLDQAFMDQLDKHPNREYIKEVKKFSDEMARKTFIFLEFTRERSTCTQMIDILRDCGQESAAKELETYNKSPAFMAYSYETELPVTKATILRSGGTKYYKMDGTPKGYCVIINNVKDVLEKESLRFKNVFEQIGFKVQLFYDLTAQQMRSRLKEVSKMERLNTDNALIVMTISHGQNERILASDEEEVKITEIVDLFSDEDCTALENKPKLFFFNCCRIKSSQLAVLAVQQSDRITITLDSYGQNWVNNNRYTFICYACAEGNKSWFIPQQYTHFGQALSHCIAQYACDKSIQTIMNLTSERMATNGSPEIRLCKMTRELYLNPGLPEIKEKQMETD